MSGDEDKSASPHSLLCVLIGPPQANPQCRWNWMNVHCSDRKGAGGYHGDGGEGDGDGGGVPPYWLVCVCIFCMIVRTAVVLS